MSCFIHTTFNLHWSIYEKIVMILLATFALGTFSSFANAGRCDHYWQTAKDGSVCGDRAADRRPGGQ